MVLVVKKKPGDSDDRLIAEFRKKIQAEQLLTKLRELEFYKPKSVEKKEKKAALKRKKRR